MFIEEEFIPIYTLILDKDELAAIELAVGLMLDNEWTHQNWHDVLGPIHADLVEILEIEEV